MLLFIIALVSGLLVYGHLMRSKWETRPSLFIYDYAGSRSDNKTLVIMWTGAFNDAPIYFERLISLYQQIGDVCVVRYPDKRFDANESVMEPYGYARKNNYKKLVLRGVSLGGEEALRLEEQVALHASGYNPEIEKILHDVPLGKQHLLPGLVKEHPLLRSFLLWIVKYVHVGPVLNKLSPWVMAKAFKKAELSQTNGVNMEQWNRHMAAMWNLQLSVLIEQVAAISRQKPFTRLTGGPAVYLRSTSDEVIDGEKASADLHALLGPSLIGDDVPVKGEHSMAVENHTDCRKADVEALTRLGYAVV